MKFDEIKTVGVLGGGIMGGGIAQGLAIGGYQVVIRDISEEMIEATRQAVFEGKWGIKRAVELGKLKFDDGVAAIARVSFTTTLAGLAQCDFIIEAIPEKLESQTGGLQRTGRRGETRRDLRQQHIRLRHRRGRPRRFGISQAAVRGHALFEPRDHHADVRSDLHATDQ